MYNSPSNTRKFIAFSALIRKETNKANKEIRTSIIYSFVAALLSITPIILLSMMFSNSSSEINLAVIMLSFCLVGLVTALFHAKVYARIVYRRNVKIRDITAGYSIEDLAFFFNNTTKNVTPGFVRSIIATQICNKKSAESLVRGI